jgi:GAF domain-containing protein
VLGLVARRSRELFDADHAAIALPAPEGGGLRVAFSIGEGEHELTGMELPSGGSLSGLVLRTGESVVVVDAATDDRVHQPMADAIGAGPMAFVPLQVQDEPFGTLSVARAKGREPFAAPDVVTLRSFAVHAGIASTTRAPCASSAVSRCSKTRSASRASCTTA